MNRPFVFIMALVAAGLIGKMMLVILPALIIISMISIVGIPLGIALMALPTLYAYLVVAGAICWVLTPSWRSFMIGVAVALGIGILLPALINSSGKAEIAEIEARQFELATLPANLPAIWVLEETKESRVSDSLSRCGNLCLYLLYVKSAPQVGSRLVINDQPEAIKFYRVEKRASCEVPRFLGSAFDSQDLITLDSIKSRMAAGECLVESAAEPASYLLASFTQRRGYYRETTDLSAGVVNLRRLVVSHIEGSNNTLLLDRTAFSGGLLAQPLYFNLEGGFQLQTWFVLARSYFASNDKGQRESAKSVSSADDNMLDPALLLQKHGFIK